MVRAEADRLQRLGLLSRGRSSTDGRVVRMELTDDGRRLLDAVTERRRQDRRQILDEMRPEDAATVAAALQSFDLAAGESDLADSTSLSDGS
jgi:DNA-binding MarR family transcriptional regulator